MLLKAIDSGPLEQLRTSTSPIIRCRTLSDFLQIGVVPVAGHLLPINLFGAKGAGDILPVGGVIADGIAAAFASSTDKLRASVVADAIQGLIHRN